MAYTPHSEDQYNFLFHHVWCLGHPIEKSAELAGMNPTHAFRAATGWANGKDGAVGRKAFLAWMKGCTSEVGAPCCGAHVVPGKRKPREVSAAQQEQLATLRELEDAKERMLKDVARLRKKLGLATDDITVPDSVSHAKG